MRLSNLPSLGLTSILFNALHSHAHSYQLLGAGKLPIPDSPSPEKLVGTNWQLTEINGAAAIPDSQELFFQTETVVSGYDGCNWFNGEWSTVENGQDSQTSDRPSIKIGMSMAHTRRACRLTAEAGKQQGIFMSTLRQAAISFSLSADEKELTLYRSLDGKDMPIVLSRIPKPVQPHERLIGTDWIATGIVYFDSQNKLRPVLEDHPVTLSFSEDQISGSTGTNQYFGEISQMTSMEFQVTSVGQTLIGWEESNDPRRSQEDAWMSILHLGRAANMTIAQEFPEAVTLPYTLFDERIGETDEWTQVLILGSFQAPLARFVPLKDGMLDEWGKPIKKFESPLTDDTPFDEDEWHYTIQLAGSNWRATNIRGALLSDDSDSQSHADVNMFFSSESSLEGSGGCNSFHASWETLEMLVQMNDTQTPRIHESLQVKDFIANKMYCDDKIAQVENYFFSGLAQELILYEFDGEGIKLWDAVRIENGQHTRGNFIGRFTNVPVPSWGGESLIGMAGEEAKRVIEAINPSLQVHIIQQGWGMTADFRLDRVRIFVDGDGNVTKEPQRG